MRPRELVTSLRSHRKRRTALNGSRVWYVVLWRRGTGLGGEQAWAHLNKPPQEGDQPDFAGGLGGE